MMPLARLQIHRDHQWIPAATLEPMADGRVRVDYLPDYIFSEDPQRVALDLPVGFAPPLTGGGQRETPPFLFDLVPQGRGRRLLLQLLGLQDHDGLLLPLIEAGAFNPIGNLRIDSALAFYEGHVARNPLPPGLRHGFTLEDLTNREHGALEHLSVHAMLASGTTGVQGAAPKYLLTEDAQGRLHADMALADDDARAHWLAKAPRANSEEDRRVLRNEAAYLRVAAACGLRTHAMDRVRHSGDVLLVPRFDRIAGPEGVTRVAQESLASLAGLRGFGVPCRLNRLLHALRTHVTDPLADTIEFLRRDVLNQAMRNTDNHARNHALQRLPDGRVQLTPLFDFAPMFLDPELVPRALHWADAGDTRLHAWEDVLPALQLAPAETAAVAQALAEFAPTVSALADTMRDCGVDPKVVEACRAQIAEQAGQLQRVRVHA